MTVVDAFAADHFVVNRISPDRQRMVRRALRELSQFSEKPLEELTDRDLQAFLTHLVSSGLHVDTVRKYNHAIKPFYKWAWREHVIDADMYLRIKDVPNPRGATSQRPPRPYKRTDIMLFWDQLNQRWPRATTKQLARWQRGTSSYRRIWRHGMYLQTRAVAGLALYGGMRRSEIWNLTLDDLHPDNEYIVVRGKTEVHTEPKLREVPFTERGREEVAEWLAYRDLMQPDHDRPWLLLLAQVREDHPFAPAKPSDKMREPLWERILSNVGDWHMHRFRHTAATEWLRSGMPLERVQYLLGHATLQQTLGYAEILRGDVGEAMRRYEATFISAIGSR